MILHLLLFSFFTSATSSEPCFETRCNGETIKFPFRIQNLQSKSCGYPGFELSCNATTSNSSQPLLHLPFSGDFSVKFIDYKNQEIRIGDPNNCLPRKILSLDLSGSPFRAKNGQNFTFFRCSSSFSPPDWYHFDPIECLSSSLYSVFAASSPVLVNLLSSSSNCVAMKNVSVSFSSSKMWDDLVLRWENPDCRKCESLGRRCEFNSNSTNILPCMDNIAQVSRSGRPRIEANVVSIALGVVVAVFCLLGLLCCFCIKMNSQLGSHNSSIEAHWTQFFRPTDTMGLDGPTIDSYPTFELDESLSIPKPNNNICPICLAQYRPKEIVKSIPNCQHCFHQSCIDEWLRLKASCPVCRKSPIESPPSDPS